MKNKIWYIISYFVPVTRNRYEADMGYMMEITEGMTEEMKQQAEIITNLMQKFAVQDIEKTKKPKTKTDIAFG